MKLLLEHRVNDHMGLQAAAEGGHIDVLRILLDHGAWGIAGAALGEAARRGYLDMVKLLWDNGVMLVLRLPTVVCRRLRRRSEAGI